MSLTNDIPTKLRIPAQLALDAKSVVTSLSQLQTLGSNNNLAYTYFKGMLVYCAEDNSFYMWRPAEVGDPPGTLAANFTYPNGIVSEDGVIYSNAAYNFFKVTYITLENLAQLVQMENIGGGSGLFKQFNPATNKFEFYTIASESIQISLVDNVYKLELPSAGVEGAIPSLRANQDFSPTYQDFLNYYTNVYLVEGGIPLANGDPFEYKGEGSQVKPYTNTRTFTFGQPGTIPTITPDSAIDNLLEAYVGTGTKAAPENVGKQLIIEESVNSYSFNNDFNYSRLFLKVRENLNCTTSNLLVDLDDALIFDNDNDSVTIDISTDKILQFDDSLGFNNSGNSNSSVTPFSTGKTIVFPGEGKIYSSYDGPDVLTRYILNGEGNFNDSNLHYQIKSIISAEKQGVYKSKNFNRIDFYNAIQSGRFLGTVNTDLKAFHMEGGQVRFFEKGSIYIGSETSGRLYGVTFEPTGDGIGFSVFSLNSATVSGSCNYAFVKLNNENVSFYGYNSPSGNGFRTVTLGTETVINGLFKNFGIDKWSLELKNCIFSYTGINFDEVDLTQGNNVSSVNYLGNLIVESLVVFPYRRDGGSNTVGNLFLPKYSKFINQNGSLVESEWYVDVML